MGTGDASWYLDTVRVPLAPAPALAGAQRADVCVVGGGITGCSAALHLAQRGHRVKLLEARRIGWGASGRAGGHIQPGLGTDMEVIAASLGRDDAHRVWNITLEAMDLLESLVEEHRIPCDLQRGYVHAAIRPRHLRYFRELQRRLAEDHDYDGMHWLDRDALRERVRTERYLGGLYEPRAGSIHPLNYTLGLARAAQSLGVELHEDSPVTRIERGSPARVHTASGSVRADHVVLACNAYLDDLEPALRAKIMPVSNYIVATEPLDDEQVAGTLPQHDAVSDANFVLDYYHLSADHRLLYGGEVSYDGREPRNLRRRLEAKMVRLFPSLRDVRIEYMWGGRVGITLNRFPHFGRMDDNVYYAHGYSGLGLAMAGMAGKLLAETIAGQAERFDVFARMRHRDFPGGRRLRTPLLVLATTFYRMRNLI